MKVLDEAGNEGLVPSSYLELSNAASTSKPSIAAEHNVTEPKISTGKQKGMRTLRIKKTHMIEIPHACAIVRALYDYEAQGPDELDIKSGEIIELTEGPTGGRNYAEGWWEGMSIRLGCEL